jgi:hypothetical protein
MFARRVGPLVGLVLAVILAGCAGLTSPPVTVGMIDVPPGCPDLYEHLERIAAERTVTPGTGVDVSRDRTAIDTWGESESIDAAEIRRFLGNVHREFALTSSGRLRATGIEVEVRTDGPGVSVDLDALDDLVVEVLRTDYPDARIRALMDCYLERITIVGELADRPLRLYVTSDPSYCFRGLVLTPRGADGCDAIGVSLPEVQTPSRVTGVALRWPATIAITPVQLPETALQVEVRAALFLAHELVHYLDNEMGAGPRLSTLGAYERRAYYVQETLGALVRDGVIDLPTPLVWDERP